jgi:phenylalanyl-tRNA synthetase beta chain
VHPAVLKALDVRGPAVAFTLRLAALPLPKAKSPTRPALVLSDLQAVERDFAFVVDDRVEAAVLVNAAQGADKALIDSVRVFDVFAGDKAAAQIGPGKKSLALTVRLQPTERTLTEAEIEAVGAKVVDKVMKASGGTLRKLLTEEDYL